MSERVAVAGGSGFIGTHVVAALRASGRDVVVLSRRPVTGDRDAIACDVTEPVDPAVFAGCQSVVNLVGIAHERGANTFMRAHVDAVRNLVAACRAAGVRRLVHVGVVDVPGTGGPYRDSKRAGEEIVRESDLDWTIVRPGLVVGPGDQALSNLVRAIRSAPIFPVPAGAGPLQPVDVRDVALAIVRALDRDASCGHAYDVVGPERLDLGALARRVGAALELPLSTPAIPRTAMALVAAVSERVLPRPFVTRAQLDMLVAGLVGDPTAARRELDLSPRAVDEDVVREHAASVADLPVPALRLTTGAEHRAWLRGLAPASSRITLAIPLLVAAMIALPFALPDVWTRMLVILAAFAGFAIARVPLPWRELARVRASQLGFGLVLAAAMGGATAIVLAATAAIAPGELARLGVVWTWIDRLPLPALAVALGSIVVLEDVVWRAMVALPLAARLGPWRGTALGAGLFAAAHVTTGPPLLVVGAFACGWVWNLAAVRGRSLVPVVVSHLAFDFAVVLARPH